MAMIVKTDRKKDWPEINHSLKEMEIIIITFQKILECTNPQKCISYCLKIHKQSHMNFVLFHTKNQVSKLDFGFDIKYKTFWPILIHRGFRKIDPILMFFLTIAILSNMTHELTI